MTPQRLFTMEDGARPLKRAKGRGRDAYVAEETASGWCEWADGAADVEEYCIAESGYARTVSVDA